jgi:hypothetical protein
VVDSAARSPQLRLSLRHLTLYCAKLFVGNGNIMCCHKGSMCQGCTPGLIMRGVRHISKLKQGWHHENEGDKRARHTPSFQKFEIPSKLD